jgi:hypothetical protein
MKLFIVRHTEIVSHEEIEKCISVIWSISFINQLIDQIELSAMTCNE